MRRSYVYRIMPNANQRRELEIMLETHRRLYNECLEWKRFAFETFSLRKSGCRREINQQKREATALALIDQIQTGKGRAVRFRSLTWDFPSPYITKRDQQIWLTRQQKLGHPYYSRLNSHSARTTIERLDNAFQSFFRRVKKGEKPGYPRFKGKNAFDSFRFGSYPDGLKLEGDRLHVQHVTAKKGSWIKVVLHRPIPADATIKTASIKRSGDKWYVVLSLEMPTPAVLPNDRPRVGIDLGLKHFAALAVERDGGFEHPEPIANPRNLAASLAELRRAGRAVSRKKKGGSNRRKAVKRLRRIHEQLTNRRRDFHSKVSVDLVRRFGAIAAEGLDVKGMLSERKALTRRGQRRLNRSISDAAWGSFIGALKSKAESAGVSVVEVDPKGTTQECSRCKAVVPKTLRDRNHDCPDCGLSLDRDMNAARNVFQRAFPARTGPAGDTSVVSPGQPADLGPKIPARTQLATANPPRRTSKRRAPR